MEYAKIVSSEVVKDCASDVLKRCLSISILLHMAFVAWVELAPHAAQIEPQALSSNPMLPPSLKHRDAHFVQLTSFDYEASSELSALGDATGLSESSRIAVPSESASQPADSGVAASSRPTIKEASSSLGKTVGADQRSASAAKVEKTEQSVDPLKLDDAGSKTGEENEVHEAEKRQIQPDALSRLASASSRTQAELSGVPEAPDKLEAEQLGADQGRNAPLADPSQERSRAIGRARSSGQAHALKGQATRRRGSPVGPDLDERALRAGYLKRLVPSIQRSYFYPKIGRRMGFEGRVLVEVIIDREGRVLHVALKRASPHAVLNEAALASLKRLGRLPAPPHPLLRKNGRMTLVVPMVYELS